MYRKKLLCLGVLAVAACSSTSQDTSDGGPSSGDGGAATNPGSKGTTDGGAGGGGATDGGSKGGSKDGGSGGAGEVLFTGDFETGDLSQWPYVERCATNRIVVYSTADAPSGAPTPRGGTYAVLFHVLDGDVAPCTSTENPRAELNSPDLFTPGDDRWEAWSLYVPSGQPTPNTSSGAWLVHQADYGAPFPGSPSVGWDFDFTTPPCAFVMNRNSQYGFDQPWQKTMITDQWVDFVVHKKFSNADDGTGFVEAWVNGTQITFNASGCSNCTTLSMQTMYASQSTLQFYLMAYRQAGLLSSFDIYFDEVRVGTTQGSVAIP